MSIINSVPFDKAIWNICLYIAICTVVYIIASSIMDRITQRKKKKSNTINVNLKDKDSMIEAYTTIISNLREFFGNLGTSAVRNLPRRYFNSNTVSVSMRLSAYNKEKYFVRVMLYDQIIEEDNPLGFKDIFVRIIDPVIDNKIIFEMDTRDERMHNSDYYFAEVIELDREVLQSINRLLGYYRYNKLLVSNIEYY